MSCDVGIPSTHWTDRGRSSSLPVLAARLEPHTQGSIVAAAPVMDRSFEAACAPEEKAILRTSSLALAQLKMPLYGSSKSSGGSGNMQTMKLTGDEQPSCTLRSLEESLQPERHHQQAANHSLPSFSPYSRFDTTFLDPIPPAAPSPMMSLNGPMPQAQLDAALSSAFGEEVPQLAHFRSAPAVLGCSTQNLRSTFDELEEALERSASGRMLTASITFPPMGSRRTKGMYSQSAEEPEAVQPPGLSIAPSKETPDGDETFQTSKPSDAGVGVTGFASGKAASSRRHSNPGVQSAGVQKPKQRLPNPSLPGSLLPAQYRCQIDGCGADLSGCKPYVRRYRLCWSCMKSASVQLRGKAMRFCQQCSRLHELRHFDGQRKSCRSKLLELKNRRTMQH